MKPESKEHTGVIGARTAASAGFSLARSLRQAFGFFTILPVSTGSLDAAADAAWLLPVVAVVLGAIEGLVAWGLSFIFGPLTIAAIVLAVALVLTGLHHADGLADIGDAIMARGGAARRIEVLKDRTLGVGAAGALILTYLVSWSSLTDIFTALAGGGDLPTVIAGSSASLPAAVAGAGVAIPAAKVISALIIVEVSARFCMIIVAILTPSSHEGSGRVFIDALKGRRGAAGIALSLAALIAAAPLVHWSALFAAAAAMATAAIISLIARRWFGGAGGDILGASVEWGRMAALLTIAGALLA